MSKKRSSEEEAPRTNRSVSQYFRDLIVIDIDPEHDRFVEKFIREELGESDKTRPLSTPPPITRAARDRRLGFVRELSL